MIEVLLAAGLLGAVVIIWRQGQAMGDLRVASAQATAPAVAPTPAPSDPAPTARDLAQISREMQHPLNGIISMAALLREGPLSPVQEECLETMSTSAEVLKILIDDLMEVSLLELSELSIEVQAFDLRATFDSLTDTLQMRARAQEKTLNVVIDDGVPAKVEGDKARLSQLLGRLLNAAIEGTVDDAIDVRLSAGEILENRFWLLVELRTQSAWLDAQDIANLANEGETESPRQVGWALCRQLADVLGGYVGVENDLRHTAWMAVPLKTPNAESRRPHLQQVATLPPRVLIVDDNVINRRVLERLLSRLGCETGRAADGGEAVDRVREEHWDLVLMDCELPVLDGYEATRQIRQLPGISNEVPIVAVTAHTDPNHANVCREAGMNDYLRKPIRLETLRTTLNRYAGSDPRESFRQSS